MYDDFDMELWCFHIGNLVIPSPQWDFLLGTLTDAERTKALKYHFDDDRKRSLLSKLLQKAMIRQNFMIRDEAFSIRSTSKVIFFGI